MSQTKAQLLDNIKDNVQLDAQKALRFADSDSSHYVAFRAPGTVSSSVTWTLPAADGSANYVLATDGSGTLSWIADPAGQWVTSGSNVYYTAGNVGIGDSSPSNPLSVTGASAFNGDVQFTGASYNVTWDKSADALIFNDNARAKFGTGGDLELYHSGSHSYIKDAGTGNLYMHTNYLIVSNAGGTEDLLKAAADGAVELYYDGTLQTKTTSTGLHLADSKRIDFGTGSDLRIYHDGSNSYIADEGTGDIVISSGTITFKNQARDETHANFIGNGAVELYHNNVKKFETTSGGVEISGIPKIKAGNQLELDNGFNNKAAKIQNSEGSGTSDLRFYTGSTPAENFRITASGNAWLPNDNGKLMCGAGTDLQIYHDGTLNVIDASSGNLEIRHGAEKMIACANDGQVELYHDNFKSFETWSNGIYVYGPEGGGGIIRLYGDEGDDNADKWDFNANTDGTLLIRNYTSGSWETNLKATGNGAVELYHNNSKKFQTATHGVNIYDTADTNVMAQFDNSAGTVGFVYGANANEFGLLDGQQHWLVEGRKDAEVRVYYDGAKKLSTYAEGIKVHGSEGESAGIHLIADEGDDNGDTWRINCNHDDHDITFANDDSGTLSDIYTFRKSGNLVINKTPGNIGDGGETGTEIYGGYYIMQVRSQNTSCYLGRNGNNGTILNFLYDGGSVGSVSTNGNNLPSDRDYKKDITDLTLGLNLVNKLKPISYRYKYLGKDDDPVMYGLVAQDLEQSLLDCSVAKNSTSLLQFDDTGDPAVKHKSKYHLSYERLIPVLINAVKELSTEVNTLKTKVAALESA